VRRERERELRRVLPRVARSETQREVGVRIGRVRGREVEHRHADQRADAGVVVGARRRVRVEVHVVAAGDAAAQHLGAREQRAVVDEFGRHEPALARPDVLLEPGLQRHVVGDAAQQCHRRVRVCVDEAGDQRVRGQRDRLARRERGVGLGRGHDRENPAVVDDERVAGEHAGRLDGHDPRGVDAEVDGLARDTHFTRRRRGAGASSSRRSLRLGVSL